MAGTVVIDKNAGSTFGAAIRGGDLVCKGVLVLVLELTRRVAQLLLAERQVHFLDS